MFVCEECGKKFHNGRGEAVQHATTAHAGHGVVIRYVNETISLGFNG